MKNKVCRLCAGNFTGPSAEHVCGECVDWGSRTATPRRMYSVHVCATQQSDCRDVWVECADDEDPEAIALDTIPEAEAVRLNFDGEKPVTYYKGIDLKRYGVEFFIKKFKNYGLARYLTKK